MINHPDLSVRGLLKCFHFFCNRSFGVFGTRLHHRVVFPSVLRWDEEPKAAEEPAELRAAGSGLPAVFLCAGRHKLAAGCLSVLHHRVRPPDWSGRLVATWLFLSLKKRWSSQHCVITVVWSCSAGQSSKVCRFLFNLKCKLVLHLLFLAFWCQSFLIDSPSCSLGGERGLVDSWWVSPRGRLWFGGRTAGSGRTWVSMFSHSQRWCRPLQPQHLPGG